MPVSVSESVSPPLTITLFGPIQIQIYDRPLPPLRSRKSLWLLALLTLRQGRPVEREWLAGILWPDTAPIQASTYLSVVLSELRRALGDQRERLQSPARHVLTLNLAEAEVDVATFDAAMLSKKPEALKQAVALYRGPLLEDCVEEWVFQERTVRAQDCLQALQQLGDYALAAGDNTGAIGYYRRAVTLDPWREGARRGWMEALARSEDRNAAMQVYREYVEWLRGNSGALPDKETSALYQRLRTEARREALSSSAVTADDERALVKQEALVKEAAAPVLVKGYLPHPLTDLIGRKEESREVAAKLRAARLVTLTGAGGIGKTRLAIEVARESIEEGSAFPEGVWLVALESLSEGGLVVAQIVSVLGLREEAGRSLLESLTEYLRPKRLLLVLDNCEHLLEASAQVAAYLLRECGRMRILATSREALGITGETVWQVPVLSTPDPQHLPQDADDLRQALTGYESVQLFIERAQAVQKGFALSRSNALAVAQVCSQLEGIPLALELAAARVKAMALEQIAARLNDRLSLLTGGNRSAQSRQQTLRATLDWSYALLSEVERVLLHRLSVFAGGWTLEAAEQVCVGKGIEAGQALGLLIGLVEKSLVVFEERGGETSGRYRLLETVRQYAAEQLQESGEVDAVRQRHRDWLAALAEEADLNLNGAEQEQWLNRLETEHANVRVTLSWNAKAAESHATELRLVGTLWQFWDRHGHHSEGRHYLLRALERPETQEATPARGKTLTGAAVLALRQGDLAAARALHQQSLRVYQQLGNKPSIAIVLSNEGVVAWNQGDYPAARSLLEESLSLQRELGNKLGIASALHGLGHLVQWQGDYATARTYFAESLDLFKELGNQRNIAFVLEGLGGLDLLQGEYAGARTLFEESLSMRRELGDKHGIALSMGNLGLCANFRGETEAAYSLFEESLNLFRELGDRRGIALSISHLGIVTNEIGDPVRAQMLLEEGLTLLRQSEDRDSIAFALSNLGNVVKERGDYAAARALVEESLTIRAAMGNRLAVAESLERLASVLCLQSETQKAAPLWGAASALRKTLGAPMPPHQREKHDRQVEQARSQMGKDAFDAAWEEGRALSWEQAVAFALTVEPEF